MIKKIAITVVCIIILLVGMMFAYASYLGLIPREDYDEVPPELPEFTKPVMLIFNKTNGFIHRDALPAGDAMLTELAKKNGWEVFITDNGAIHNAEDLKRFEVIVWNNTSGDVLTETQRADLKNWIENGGGWVGIHAAGGDPKYKWRWYVDTLIGAQFVGHTMDPQFQDADLYVTDPEVTVTNHLPTPLNVKQEEWYAFDQNPRDKGYEILITIDEDSYITQGSGTFGTDRMEGEHPLVWRHPQGEGRVFYSSIGHTPETYSVPEYQELIYKAINWAAEK